MHDERTTHPDRRTLLKAMGAGAIAATAPIAGGAVPAAAETGEAATTRAAEATRAAAAPAITPEELAHLPLVGGREFPIGLWWPPPPLQTTLARYQEIKDAGFTYTHSNNYLWADAYIQKYALGIADQVGLTLVVDDATVRWMRNDFRVSSEGGDFTLTPEQAETKLRQVLDTYRPRSFWEVRDGRLLQNGGTGSGSAGLSREGADWSDYTFAFDVAPRQTGGGGKYAQAGWAFRAQDPANAYVWLLSNSAYTTPAAPGYLTKVLFVNGRPAWVRPVPLTTAVTDGTWYHVETKVAGDTITTSINGTVVDTTTDATYARGRVGFREAGPESALFDNVKVTTADGKVVLTDDFSGNLEAWNPPNAGGSPAFAGLDIYDEPSPDRFETLAHLVRITRELDPNALPYINLLPSNDPNYVRQFVDVVKPVLLSFDRYPLMADGTDDPGYFLNWKIIREEGLRAGLPTWIFIQTGAYGNRRQPTPAELLWQINVSLAYGAKGIQYFTYWTPDPARGEGFQPALITVDGKRTDRYDAAKNINLRWLAPVGRELKPLVSESVTHAHDDPLPAGATAWTPDEVVKSVQGGAVVLGRFVDAERTGTRWLLIANRSHSERCVSQVELDPAAVGNVARFDPRIGTYVDQDRLRLTANLDAGAAVLYRLRPASR
ncbi:family 16 glycoside hydrolase [Actinopolymorpha singaporensis]